jgi:cysteine desulfurase/selenocysteine lyase
VKPNIAKLINASPDEITLTKNGSEALSIIINGLPFQKGDNVVISNLEFQGNVLPWLRLRDQKGLELRIAKADEDLLLDPTSVQELVDEKTKLISIVHVVNSIGTVQPVEEIGRLAKDSDTLFLLNASMSCGCIPIDVQRMKCDFLFAPGRKWLRGPDSGGFLYINEKVIDKVEPPSIGYVGAYWLKDEEAFEYLPGAKRYEVGDQTSVTHLGLGLAVEYALNLGIGQIEKRIRKLISLAYDGIAEIPDVELYGTNNIEQRVFLAMNIKDSNASLVRSLLRDRSIVVEAGDFLTLMIPDVIGVEDWLRVSPHYFCTEQEIEKFVDAIKEISRRYKGTMIPKRLGYPGLEKHAIR